MVFTPPAVLESKVNDNEISPACVALAEKVEDPVQVLPANENEKKEQ